MRLAMLCLYYKTFVANIRLWSLLLKRSPGYAEDQTQFYTKSQTQIVQSLHISTIFVKTKLTMAGWLKEVYFKNTDESLEECRQV